eukprot:2002831-Pyramimonas_sp.AAC.1
MEQIVNIGRPIDKLCVIEKDSKLVRLYCPRTGEHVKDLHGRKGAAVNCVALPRSKGIPIPRGGNRSEEGREDKPQGGNQSEEGREDKPQ